MDSEKLLGVLRAAAAEATASGALPSFLADLERVRAEALLAAVPEPTVPVSASTSAPTPGETPDRLLSAHETAARLGTSTWWVRANRGDLPLVRLPGGRYKFSEKKLARWIERRA
jgi:hypothetical protein